MDSLFFMLALITSGVALVTGLNGILMGLKKESDKVDLVFGIQSLLLFIFILLPPTGFIANVKAPYPVELHIKRIFIWLYYGLSPLFFKYYSGYNNKVLKLTIYLFSGFSYALLLTTELWEIDDIFRLIVLIALGLICIYGLLAARYQVMKGDKSGGTWLRFAMYVYMALFLLQLPFFAVNEEINRLTGLFNFPSFNLNPLAFILIMGIRLRSNITEKYRIERNLRSQNSRWDQLLQNIELLVVEVDKEGTLKYINPYGVKCIGATSAEKCRGLNWFKTFLKPYDQNRVKALFNAYVNGESSESDIKFTLVGLDGVEHNISWTNVLVPDENGHIMGLMSFGIDTTVLDEAFKQVEALKNELAKENLHLKEAFTDVKQSEIIGNSDTIIYAIQKARQVAETHATVLLEGETGVGKELFANLVHRMSMRNKKPLVKVNCAALPDELIESELFGHEKGSFTGALQARKGRFELADGGTILLDEISELPLSLQAKLLRVLQSGEFERIGGQQTLKVNVRVISSTNLDLMNEVKRGNFREDLFYRLNVYPITIPPLRKRRSDIPLLVDHFIRKFAIEFNKDVTKISKADLNRIMEYDWPGNVRELINLIERSMISSSGNTLRIAWQNHETVDIDPSPQVLSIKDLERDHIIKVLNGTHWKINGVNGAAEKLGLNPNTLRSKMKKLNISREKH
jgi:formate hydrogenlyase transcriptional activator